MDEAISQPFKQVAIMVSDATRCGAMAAIRHPIMPAKWLPHLSLLVMHSKQLRIITSSNTRDDLCEGLPAVAASRSLDVGQPIPCYIKIKWL